MNPIFALTNKVKTSIFSPPLRSLDGRTLILSDMPIALSSRHETNLSSHSLSSIVNFSPAFH